MTNVAAPIKTMRAGPVTGGDCLAELGGFCSALTSKTLDAPAAVAVRRLLLDSLAVGWAGADAPGVAELAAIALAEGGRPEARVWGRAERLPAQQAALVNGAAAAALDFDSVHDGAVSHPSILAVPAALAVAERAGASGADLAAAVAAGSEIICRLAMATPRQSGWFYTSVYGALGAAAAAARVLGLEAGQCRQAMSLAFTQAAGTKQAIVERTLAKRLQSAFAVRSGVLSALLAARGVTGPAGALEGDFGLFSLYEGGDPAQVVAGLGERFHFAEAGIKKYPSCLCTHAAIDAALALRSDPAFDPTKVERVEVMITPYMQRIVGRPFDPDPDYQVAAQFSIQYAVAAALQRGRFSLEELDEVSVRDPALGDRARAVAVMTNPQIDGHLVPASVHVTLDGGRRLEREVTIVPGSPAAPVSDRELELKARACFARGPRPLAPSAVHRLIARLDDLARLDDVSCLLDDAAG